MTRTRCPDLPLLRDLLPPSREAVIVECPFHEVSEDSDWLVTQLAIVRQSPTFGDWKRLALCGPRDSIHCYLCHQSLRRATERSHDDHFLASNRAVVNTTRG